MLLNNDLVAELKTARDQAHDLAAEQQELCRRLESRLSKQQDKLKR